MLSIILDQASPYLRGEAHGETFRSLIHELVEIRRGLSEKFLSTLSKEEIDDLAKKHIARFRHWAEIDFEIKKLFEEFQGIVTGASASEEDIYILNNYTDLRDYASNEVREEGCSAFSYAAKNYEGNGKTIISGQTWDMHVSARDYMLKIQTEGMELLTVTGCLALAGVNRQRVMVQINNMHCSETSDGLAWPALVKGMLFQESAEMAFEFLKNHMPCSGHNYLISDPNHTFNVETTGKQWELAGENGGKFSTDQELAYVLHTNHYLGNLKEHEILARQSPSTHVRYTALQAYFAKVDSNKVTRESLLKEVLGGECVPEVSILDAPSKHAGATCGGIIFDMGSGKGEMFSGVLAHNKKLSFSIPPL